MNKEKQQALHKLSGGKEGRHIKYTTYHLKSIGTDKIDNIPVDIMCTICGRLEYRNVYREKINGKWKSINLTVMNYENYERRMVKLDE